MFRHYLIKTNIFNVNYFIVPFCHRNNSLTNSRSSWCTTTAAWRCWRRALRWRVSSCARRRRISIYRIGLTCALRWCSGSSMISRLVVLCTKTCNDGAYNKYVSRKFILQAVWLTQWFITQWLAPLLSKTIYRGVMFMNACIVFLFVNYLTEITR